MLTASNWDNLGRFKWVAVKNTLIFIFGLFGCIIGTVISLQRIIENFIKDFKAVDMETSRWTPLNALRHHGQVINVTYLVTSCEMSDSMDDFDHEATAREEKIAGLSSVTEWVIRW